MSKSIQTVPGQAYTVSFSKAGNVIARGPEGQSLTLVSVQAAQQASFIAISTDSILSDDAAVVLPVLGASNSSFSFSIEQRNDLLWLDSHRCDISTHLADSGLHLQPGERDKWNKTITDLSAHCHNTTVHLTAAERTKWNQADSNASQALKDAATAQSAAEKAQSAASQAQNSSGQSLSCHCKNTDLHLQSGERTKWNKAITDLSAHCKNTTVHLTAAERTKWNNTSTCVSNHAADLSWLASNKSNLSSMQSAFSSGTLKGEKGCKGCRGLQGVKGCVGAKGCKGAKGCTGAKGCKGAKGDKGCKGCKGDPGGGADLCAETNYVGAYMHTRFGYCSTICGGGVAVGPYSKVHGGYAFGPAAEACQGGIAIGSSASARGDTGVIAIGDQAVARAQNAIALGPQSEAQSIGSMALGNCAMAAGLYSTAIGYKASNRYASTFLLQMGTGTHQLKVWFIAAGSDLSNLYLGGKSGVAYLDGSQRGIKALDAIIGTTYFSP